MDPLSAPEKLKKPFTFICGNDEFLVNQQGEILFKRLAEGLEYPLSSEMIDGMANNVSDAESITGRFLSAIQTLSMFGDKKVVWLKGVTFLGDNQTGRAESTKAMLESLLKVLSSLDPKVVSVIITASPVDRRTRIYKTFQKESQFTYLESESSSASLEPLVKSEFKQLNIAVEPEAISLLLEKVKGNTRLLVQEIHKLASYVGYDDIKITESLVNELIPQFREGDFFEATEAFYSLNIDWALDALRRYFFNQKDARAMLSALQNRNRLLIQLRTLLDAQAIRTHARGIDKASLEAAASQYQFPVGDSKSKSSFNVFTQNSWYLGKLVEIAKKIPLRQLVNYQNTFLDAFEGILQHPHKQEAVLRSMIIKCLA